MSALLVIIVGVIGLICIILVVGILCITTVGIITEKYQSI
jgi:hypothetical protein